MTHKYVVHDSSNTITKNSYDFHFKGCHLKRTIVCNCVTRKPDRPVEYLGCVNFDRDRLASHFCTLFGFTNVCTCDRNTIFEPSSEI